MWLRASDTLDVGKYGLVVEYMILNGYMIYTAMIKMSYYFVFGNCFYIFVIIKKCFKNILNSHFCLYFDHINYGCFNKSTRIVLTSISLELSQETFPKWTHWITLQTSCSQRKERSLGKCSPIPTLASQKNSSLLSLFIMHPRIQWDLVNSSISGKGSAVAILVAIAIELFCVASIYISKGIT